MIRRWSRINNYNIPLRPLLHLSLRFKILSMYKALNFKMYVQNLTKFKRQKLSSWRRKQNWLVYSQILRYWIRDYSFNKKTVRSQFIEAQHACAIYAFNYNLIKKKTPLLDLNIYGGVLNQLPKLIFSYCTKKFPNQNPLLVVNFIKNSNFVLYYSNDPDSISENTSLVPVAFRYDREFFVFDDPIQASGLEIEAYSKNFNFFFKVSTNTLLDFYKTFIFFILFCKR